MYDKEQIEKLKAKFVKAVEKGKVKPVEPTSLEMKAVVVEVVDLRDEIPAFGVLLADVENKNRFYMTLVEPELGEDLKPGCLFKIELCAIEVDGNVYWWRFINIEEV